MVAQLLAGMFLGSLIVSVVWAFVFKAIKSRAGKITQQRDKIMHSVGEICLEIDSLIGSYRSGVVKQDRFFESLSSKVNTVNSLLKPNLHLFEVYYVKYIENLIKEYNQFAKTKFDTQTITAGTAFDRDMETSYSPVEPEVTDSVDSTVSTSEKTVEEEVDAVDEPMVESDVETFTVEQSDSTPPQEDVFEAELEQPVVEEKGQEEEAEAEVPFSLPVEAEDDSQQSEEGVAVSEASEDVFEESLETQEQGTSVSSEIRDTVSTPEEYTHKSLDDMPIAETVIMDREMIKVDEISAAAKRADEEEEQPIPTAEETASSSESDDEMVFETATPIKESGVSVEEAKTAAPSESTANEASSDELFGEEDFSMETLIDVDINTISPYLQTENADEKAKTHEDSIFDSSAEESSKTSDHVDDVEENLEVVVASNASHTDKVIPSHSPETVKIPAIDPEPSEEKGKKDAIAFKDDIPEETTVTPASELKKNTSDASASSEVSFEVVVPEESEEREFDITTLPSSSSEKGKQKESAESVVAEEENITGDDVADKIASLEVNATLKSEKPPEKKKKAPIAKKTIEKKSSKEKPKKKNPKKDENITGDDVAEKIDAFFGLFQD